MEYQVGYWLHIFFLTTTAGNECQSNANMWRIIQDLGIVYKKTTNKTYWKKASIL